MNDALLFASGFFIIVLGLRLMNDKGGVLGLAVLLMGLAALAKACGFDWINR